MAWRQAVAPLKRWQLVWTDSGEIGVAFTHRLIARLAAWDTNRMMSKKGSTRRVEIRDTRHG
jgi:hypothetical protein